MEILNDLPEPRYLSVDGFLAFLGVYEDEGRLEALTRGLSRLGPCGVVVEAGAGLGRLSRVILEVCRPRKLFLVEENPLALEVLRETLGHYREVHIVPGLIEDFHPPEPVDLLVQELYGPLLYDESLEALHRLSFTPSRVFPDEGKLRLQVVPYDTLEEDVLTPTMFRRLEGVLVADLFPDFDTWAPQLDVLSWSWEKGLVHHPVDLTGIPGDVLVLGVEVWDAGEKLCDPARCPNWPFVFTPRVGNRFRLRFAYHRAATRTEFRWIP